MPGERRAGGGVDPVIVVIPCSATKLPVPEGVKVPAAVLYQGTYFTKCLNAARAIPGGRVVIVSGLYGLITPDTLIATYEKRLDPRTVDHAKHRAQAEAMGWGLRGAPKVIALAGKEYADAAAAVWPHLARPLAGAGIGTQLQRLTRIAESADPRAAALAYADAAAAASHEDSAGRPRPSPEGQRVEEGGFRWAIQSGMSIVDTSIAAVSAALSGLAAGAAWKASREANKAAWKANETADSVAQIERDRWHKELTPQLRIKLQTEPHEVLYVRFDSPSTLGDLAVQLTIRDDFDRSRLPHLAGTPTPEQRAEVVWGPYRFRPHVDEADGLGRAVPAFPLLPGDRHRLALDLSLKPSWYEGADGEQRWRNDYRTAPIRLWAVCTAPDHKPWILAFAVPQDGSWALGGA
ncbi:hypothetical protein LRD69_30755 [Streptomyces sp. JH14]|uniref:DUF6884 domain-containing protein n=1 Tax=Streptomyces sp. JH14 TaxID=2793630 RepID=UPI0023F9A58F|nr:DUF6884 domain-containing protein [Streptomyces sp. JH14]MDF6046424.1 hypothetical protein [Streptomyces sp. JH14]